MIRHMLKLIWNRKRSNGFLVAELLLTFFVLYIVCAIGLNTWNRYTQPDGFSVENVLNIGLEKVGARGNSHEKAPVVARIARILRDMKETQAIGLSAWGLYQMSQTYGNMTVNDRDLMASHAFIDDGCFEALDMDVVQGRGFSTEDDGSQYRAVMINRCFAQEAFGNANPLGEILQGRLIIVGVVSDYRLYGPFDPPRMLVIQRLPSINFDASETEYNAEASGDIIVKLNTPVNAELNARIFTALKDAAPGWTFNIASTEDLREACIKQQATPYLAAGVAAFSLISMVLLGLFGVLWQNIASRTKEIGLRRAKGANIGHIYTQIIGEMLVVSTVAIVPGIVIVIQLLFLDTLGFIPYYFHLLALAAAALMVYGMVVVCSLYPGYMATRINPAQALHYE